MEQQHAAAERHVREARGGRPPTTPSTADPGSSCRPRGRPRSSVGARTSGPRSGATPSPRRPARASTCRADHRTMRRRRYVSATAPSANTNATAGTGSTTQVSPTSPQIAIIKRRTETGTGRGTEQIRVDERIPEHALIARTTDDEHRPDEAGEHDAGHPDVPDDRPLAVAHAAVDRDRAAGGRASASGTRHHDGPGRTDHGTEQHGEQRRPAEAGREPPAAHRRRLVRCSVLTRPSVALAETADDRIPGDAQVVDDPRPPSGCDVVVHLDDPTVGRSASSDSQPGRAANVSAVSPQYFVQARKIRSGFCSMMYSALSCG